MDDVKGRVNSIFQALSEGHRLPPEEEADFIKCLVADGNLENSFKGKRFKNRFLDAVQKEFYICLPVEAVEKKWKLDDFVSYVAGRCEQPEANLKLARKRLEESKRADTALLVFADLMLFSIGLFLNPYPFGWLYWILYAAVNVWYFRFRRRQIRYYADLVEIIAQKQKQ